MDNLSIKNIKKGFTLIELLIVIAIIGVLMGLIAANLAGIRQRARDSQRKSDLRQIQSAVEIYRSDQGLYPNSTIPGQFPTCGNAFQVVSTIYMQKIPCDPQTGSAYTYSSNASTYSLIACLENLNDSQKDTTNTAPCTGGTTNWSYTLRNP